jgi:anaerobic selenocysteine-containing dehydrogenase
LPIHRADIAEQTGVVQHAVEARVVDAICCASCWHSCGVQVNRSSVNQRAEARRALFLRDAAQFLFVAADQITLAL